MARGELVAEIEAAAARAEAAPDAPTGYLERVRSGAGRFAVGRAGASDGRHAARLLEHQATIDVDVPTGSRAAPAALLKKVDKKLTLWYFRFVGQQVTLQGQAVARLGTATAARIEELEDEIAELRARVAELEQR
jgi:hypothetical protein